ncbi:MAG: LemA family protein [Candidatus Auribacterota bacterium]|jgi:LemA protein|nr:LemA family protein [Candidatus Auribacterota bacterium]
MTAGIIIIAVILLMVVFMYNSLIGKKNQVENSFAGIDVMLKKRYDLIPNLVSAVKTYMKHEKDVLTEITELRSKAMQSNLSDDEKIQLDNKISRAIGGIMVAVENYPQLKANENFMHLQASLNEIEEQISASRRAYNAAVTDYNNAIEMIPTSILAGMMGYRRKELFEVTEAERKNVDVNTLFNN